MVMGAFPLDQRKYEQLGWRPPPQLQAVTAWIAPYVSGDIGTASITADLIHPSILALVNCRVQQTQLSKLSTAHLSLVGALPPTAPLFPRLFLIYNPSCSQVSVGIVVASL